MGASVKMETQKEGVFAILIKNIQPFGEGAGALEHEGYSAKDEGGEFQKRGEFKGAQP